MPRRTLSSVPRLGRSAAPPPFGGGHYFKQGGHRFLATPHEVSAELAPDLLRAGLRVVDLSGAFRFREAETFTSWYKLPAPHAEWLTEAVYGIPELYSSEISQARLVANPGCYATSVILALRPLTQAGLLA